MYATDRRPLTPRMREIVTGAIGGETVDQTAARLGIRPSTVWGIRGAVCARLDSPSFLSACVTARESGLA